jgi:hypothetical protein
VIELLSYYQEIVLSKKEEERLRIDRGIVRLKIEWGRSILQEEE